MTKTEIDKSIQEFEPRATEDDKWAYRILFSAPDLGPFMTVDEFLKKMGKYWGKTPGNFQTMCRRALTNKIIRYGKKHQDKFIDSEIYSGGIGLVMGAATLQGFIKRTKDKNADA